MIIEKLPSGFYAVWNTNNRNTEYWRADLVRWDGKRGTRNEYNVDDRAGCNYYIDAENTVYYQIDGGDTGVWCSGARLNAHCHHLAKLTARR